MSAKYTIRSESYTPYYSVLNPSGVAIAFMCSWRVARKIADLYNADVEWRKAEKSIRAELADLVPTSVTARHEYWSGAVSLQEEA